MKKNTFTNLVLTVGAALIIFSASPMDAHATEYDYSGYTQDDYLQMILDADKKNGINSDDCYGSGGVHPEVKSYNADGTLQNGSGTSASNSTSSEPAVEVTPSEPKEEAATTSEPETTEKEEMETVEEHEHTYSVETTKEPTCTEDGLFTYSCECGDTYTEVINAIGHRESEGEITVAPTCVDAGTITYYCINCNEALRESETAALGHVAGESVTIKEPTRLTRGIAETKCTVCDELLETTKINIPLQWIAIDAAVVLGVLVVLITIVVICKKNKVLWKLRRFGRSIRK